MEELHAICTRAGHEGDVCNVSLESFYTLHQVEGRLRMARQFFSLVVKETANRLSMRNKDVAC